MTIDETARPRGKRGPYAKSEEKRGLILEAALEVFAQSGYRAGSLRDVALKVGMSEAGLLHHFQNKSALLAAVLERRDDHARDMIDFSGPGRQTLTDLIELVRYNSTIPGVVELYCTLSAEATSPDHPAHAFFVNRYQDTTSSITAAFTDMERHGQLRPGINPAAASRALIALMDGLQVQWLLNRDSVDMVEDIRGFLSAVATEPF
ncbi:TetR/AcrR family transcriptional regulator [Schumannella luteola]